MNAFQEVNQDVLMRHQYEDRYNYIPHWAS